jgi:2-polyprenyl-3-methyl-5-hydroxy-6-metoxy-1,4-benzoquinol methylase
LEVAKILSKATAPITILDAGCGSGYGADIFVRSSPREFTHNVFGVDCDPATIEYAALRHPMVSYVCMSAERLSFRTGHFDVVVDVDALLHMEDPLAALKNYRRLLCDAGLLFLAVPSPHNDVRALLEKGGFEVAYELRDDADMVFVGCIKHVEVDSLHDFWRESASDLARHHTEGQHTWADTIDREFIGYIEDAGAQSVLEWGCGQGDISLRLARRVQDVHLVDILDESLSRAEATLDAEGFTPATTTRVSGADTAQLPFDAVDALLCTAVVQHFPTVNYWREMAALWRSLNPEVIILQTRHGESNRETTNYATEYFTALWLSTQEVIEQFPEYELVRHHLDSPGGEELWSNVTKYEYFVFKKS